jgi:hypothetical protein
MANQFTKGTRTEHDESTKDQIRAEMLSKKYYKFAMANPKRAAKMGINSAQVASAKMLIDKGKPSLQTVEAKQVDPLEALTLEEQMEHLKAFIAEHPEFIRTLNLVPAPQQVPSTDSNELVPTITETRIDTGT